MADADDPFLRQLPAVYGMLTSVAVIGVIGNAVVLLVYLNKPQQQSATFFVIVLAFVDIFSCVVTIPFTVAIEAIQFKMRSVVLCKTYYFLFTSCIPISSLLITAIAIDRYLYICFPMKRLMTTRRARKMTLGVFVFAALIALLACFTVELKEIVTPLNQTDAVGARNESLAEADGPNSTSVWVCEEISYIKGVHHTKKIIHRILQQVNHGCYWLSIGVVTVLYSLIFITVIRLRRKRVVRLALAQQTRMSTGNSFRGPNEELPPTDFERSAQQNSHPRRASANRIPIPSSRRQRAQNGCDKRHAADGAKEGRVKGRRLLSKGSIDFDHRPSMNRVMTRHVLQTFKSASILFVVSVVFILTCLPALLMANDCIPMNLIGFYLVFANHACNPFIYCFMNRSFREDLRNIVQRRMLNMTL